MKRWNVTRNEYIDDPKVDAFLADILKVYEKHGMSIGHEDGHGAFIVQALDEENKRWLLEAHDETDE